MADSAAQWAKRYSAGLGEGGAPPSRHEWHVAYEVLKPLLAPQLRGLAEAEATIVDVGCGTSTFGVELLADYPSARLVLVDLEPLASALRAQHAAEGRLSVLAADCRSLEGLEDGSAAVLLDKGTLDAMDTPEDTRLSLRAMIRKVRPSGLFVSVSFATANRVLLLRKEAAELKLQLQLRVVPAGSEKRLVALMGSALAPAAGDKATEQFLDKLLYNGPQWGESTVHFEHEGIEGRLALQQLPHGDDRSSSSGRAVDRDTTGFFVWPAARALSAYLAKHPELVRGKRVVELGAGPGLVGLAAAALGASEVVLTDLSGTMPLLQRNVELNAELCPQTRAVELRWGAREGPGAELAGFDVVIGCELIYRLGAEVYEALVESMVKLAGSDGVCLFVVECRDGMVDDMEFFDRVNERFDVEASSLAPYGYGLSADDDEDERLLYIYRPLKKA